MSLGIWGEEVAEKYLKKKGYIIVERNFRCRLGELDIIALDGTELVFIEVKTRRNQSYGLPCEAVNSEKIRHLIRTAAFYTAVCPLVYQDVRLDVVEILKIGEKTFLRHLENITG